jgi:hypothetical protein
VRRVSDGVAEFIPARLRSVIVPAQTTTAGRLLRADILAETDFSMQ